MYGNHRDLHRLTHSFPRRRASDLRRRRRRTCGPGASGARLGDDHAGLHAGHSRQPARGLRHGPPEGASMTHDLGKYAGPADADSLYDAFSGWAEQQRSEEQTSELQSLMRTSYAVFYLKTKK